MDYNYFEKSKRDWHLARKGKFTGSKIYQLLTPGSNNMFGVGATTYINQTACDLYTEYEEGFEGNWAMREGRRKEPEAYSFYKKTLTTAMPNLEERIHFEYYGDGNPHFQIYETMPSSGASADAMMFLRDGMTPYIGGEFKCPTRKIHMDRLLQTRSYAGGQENLWKWLKNYSGEYYTQCQFLMMAWGIKLVHWNSYNDLFPEKDKLIIVEVPFDKPFCSKLDRLLSEATQRRDKIVEILKKG